MSDERILMGEEGAEEDQDLSGYRSISTVAVLGLVLGLVSPLAFWDPVLLVAPLAGIAVCVLALRRIALDPTVYYGRSAALLGLALAVGSAAAGTAHYASYQIRLRREARSVADNWFRYLTQGAPHMAHQLSLTPEDRLPLVDDALLAAYRAAPDMQKAIHEYAKQPPIPTLLRLGSQAQVRFYQSEPMHRELVPDGVVEVYAVTFPRDGKPETFFVHVVVARVQQAESGHAGWMIYQARGGYRPIGWTDGA